MQKNQWADKWKKGDHLSVGGHGITYLARRKDAPTDDYDHVLKILRDQRDTERRSRMFQEVANLRILDHEGVAKCVDSNTDHFEDEEVELFMVTEYIEGSDLQELVENDPLPLGRAASITLEIANILDYCHKTGSGGVVHRDLKPSNIIVREGEEDHPVLLDFGLSFNEETQPDGFATEDGQHLGNRFLILPELVGPGDKRDARSDISQCVGILYFLLTGLPPDQPEDKEGKRPHERSSFQRVWDNVPEEKGRQLRRILDVGFKRLLDHRWQTAEALVLELRALLADSEGESVDWHQELSEFSESLLSSPRVVRSQQIEELVRATCQLVQQIPAGIAASLSTLSHSTGPMHSSIVEGTVSQAITYADKYTGKKMEIFYEASIDGSQFIIAATLDGQREGEILRMGIFDPDCKQLIEKALGHHIVQTIKASYS